MPRAKNPKTERPRLKVKPSHAKPKRLRDRRKKAMTQRASARAQVKLNKKMRRME